MPSLLDFSEVIMYNFKGNKILKAEARESLLGNLTTSVLAVFLYMMVISVLAEMIANFSSGSVLLSLLLSVIVFFVVNTCAGMLRIGLSYIFLRLQFAKGAKVGDLFFAFRRSSDTAVTISAFLALLELFCMLPVMIALSVLSAQGRSAYSLLVLVLFAAGMAGTVFIRVRYAMCPYLFLDFPDVSAQKLIRGGAGLIRGHSLRLFRLYLSFLPLHLLGVLSLGIAGLWVSSYSHAAEAAFYRDLMAGTAN